MVTIRRGTVSRPAMALAATASGGATMAPSAIATAQDVPGISTRATQATASALPITRPMAREPIEPTFSRRRRSGVKKAAM